MAKAVRLYGGLDKIAKPLKLNRAAGKSHQAGSDSLLTMQVFFELLTNYYTPVAVPLDTSLFIYQQNTRGRRRVLTPTLINADALVSYVQ
ncbi:hypothetical protein ACS0TY_035961 [Phlomoides rotata]